MRAPRPARFAPEGVDGGRRSGGGDDPGVLPGDVAVRARLRAGRTGVEVSLGYAVGLLLALLLLAYLFYALLEPERF